MVVAENKIQMKKMFLLLMFIPLFGYSQQRPGYDPLTYDAELECNGAKKDTMFVQIQIEAFHDFFFECLTEDKDLIKVMDDKALDACPLYYTIIHLDSYLGKKEKIVTLIVAFAVNKKN